MKTNNNIYCVCYNTLDVYKSKEAAIKNYKFCRDCCDPASCEAQRYANIIIDLMTSSIGLDGVDEDVNRIIFCNDDGTKIKEIKIDWMNYKKAIEKIEKEG